MVKKDLGENSIEGVSPLDCVACGACAGSCPRRAIAMTRNALGYLVPSVDHGLCTACGLCRAVCPAGTPLRQDAKQRSPLEAWFGHASDRAVRLAGQSGGVVTAILTELLRSGRIDGAIVTRFNSQTRRAGSLYVDTEADIQRAAGSCYCQSPVVEAALAHAEKRLAIVALGCQALVVRKLVESGRFKHTPILIGLVCAGNYSGEYIDELALRCGIQPERVKRFRFRDKERKGWPGEVSVSDGRLTVFLSARSRQRLKSAYAAPACVECLQKMNPSADLVVGDPWGVSSGREGDSVVLARTEIGTSVIKEVLAAGVLSLEVADAAEVVKGQASAAHALTPEAIRQQLDFTRSLYAAENVAEVRDLRLKNEAARFAKYKSGGDRRAPRILAYGFGLDANFGGPSVVNGLSDALCHVFPKSDFVVYQPLAVDPVSVTGIDFPVRAFPYRKRMFKFYRDWLLLKLFGRRSKSAACARFWDEYRAADAVVNLYAICFCSKIRTHLSVQSLLGAVRALFCEFGPNLLARFDGKVSVKSTASYGPFGGRANRLLARLASRFAFTRAIVREQDCLRELATAVSRKCQLTVAPDLANAWEIPPVAQEEDLVGFSLSYQSEIQWKSAGKEYVPTMRDLVDYVVKTLGCRVVLFPNQFRTRGRSDATMAEEVLAGLPESVRTKVTVFDARTASPLALRMAIARCSAMISCRFHSCVAAFSSGVPQLVLGWHCKYVELAAHYGQTAAVLRTEECDLETLKAKTADLWLRRERIRDEILAHRAEVVSAVYRSVDWLFAGLGPKVSVVLPIYNVAPYLRKCLDSILAQTLKEIEVIGVDDGSTDGSWEILQEYASRDSRVSAVRQENAGAGVARNTGLVRARGEYLFFCDPDDSCDTKMLQHMYEKASATSADVVIAGKIVVDADSGETIRTVPLARKILERKAPFSAHDVADRIFTMAKAVPWDKLFRRCFVEEHGLRFQSTRRSNDVFFVDMALASAARIAALPRCYYRYSLRRQGSLTFAKDRFPLAAFEAYTAVEDALRARDLWRAFAQNFVYVYTRRMLAEFKTYREAESLETVYPMFRARLQAFRTEGLLGDGLQIKPIERERLELILREESCRPLADAIVREREAAAAERSQK